MTKIVLEALKYLPKRFIIDGTEYCEHKGRVMVVNAKYPPIWFNSKTRKWKEIKFFPGPFKVEE